MARSGRRWYRSKLLPILAAALPSVVILGALWRADRLLFEAALSLAALALAALLLREIARRERREEELKRQSLVLEAILELSPAGLWVKDEESRYLIVNPAILRQINFAKAEVIGRRTVDVVPADEVQNILDWDKAAFAQPGVTISGEDCFRVNGEVHYSLNSRVVCDIAGRKLIIGSAMDVTALRRAEQEVRSEMRQREAAEAEFRQAQKMEAIGKLTGNIAHDFNNLLTVVLGNLDRAIARVPDPTVGGLLRKAEAAAARGAMLIERLLAFARQQRLNVRSTDINQHILGMRELLARTIGTTIRIDIALGDEIWPALADANQVEVALLNIAINARDAMPNGGRLLIETANMRGGAPNFPAELPPADYVVIAISDTGIGMREDVLAKAFDPFFTTKPFGEGSGLGLSQVYGMARQSGGTATIESRVGNGTKVSLFLPRAVMQGWHALEQRAEGIAP